MRKLDLDDFDLSELDELDEDDFLYPNVVDINFKKGGRNETNQ